MTKKYDILKVRDKSDGYYTKMDRVFDLPMRLLINGPSQRSGKTTVVLNLLLRNEFYMKQFKGDNIYVISNNRLDNKLKILAEVKDIPEGNMFAYDEDKLEVLYEMLEEDFEERVADGKKPEPICMVFDDVAYSGDLKNKTAGIISKILLNGTTRQYQQYFYDTKILTCLNSCKDERNRSNSIFNNTEGSRITGR